MSENSGTLLVKAFTANEAIPIEGANITVRNSESGSPKILYFVQTDNSGISELLNLPAPNISYSLSPGANTLPYSQYDVIVEKDGYYTKTIKDVPIFSGIGAALPIDMIPITEDRISYIQNNSTITENDKL